VQSPLYESSLVYVETMEEAFRSLEAGLTEPEDYSDPVHGFTGFRLDESQLTGLIGEHAGTCYVVWERPDLGAGAGVLAGGLMCMPDARLEFGASYVKQIVVVPATTAAAPVIGWDRLLPPSGTPTWFILVISLLVWLVFNSFVSITLVMYRRRRKT
jgi:hypothetical protein